MEFPEIELVETDFEGHPIRCYVQDGVYQSATYIEEEYRCELIFPYMKGWVNSFSLLPIHSILLIGGGGYSYPKYVLSHHEIVSMDVVEIDENAEEIAKQYFYLEDILKQYDPNKKRLHTILQDGRSYLEESTSNYDVIIYDAFVGIVPVFSLVTIEGLKAAKKRLNKDGLLMINAPGYSDLSSSMYVLDVVRTCEEVFDYVSVLQTKVEEESYSSNYVIFANDSAIKLDLEMDVPKGGTILEDEEMEWYEETFVL